MLLWNSGRFVYAWNVMINNQDNGRWHVTPCNMSPGKPLRFLLNKASSVLCSVYICGRIVGEVPQMTTHVASCIQALVFIVIRFTCNKAQVPPTCTCTGRFITSWLIANQVQVRTHTPESSTTSSASPLYVRFFNTPLLIFRFTWLDEHLVYLLDMTQPPFKWESFTIGYITSFFCT